MYSFIIYLMLLGYSILVKNNACAGIDGPACDLSFDLIIHEAAQVAVTTSVIKPREDFEIN